MLRGALAPWRSRRRARPRRASPLTTAWPGALSLPTSQTPLPGGLGRDRLDLGEIEAEHRGHGALADRHRRLHGLAAQPEQARGIADREAAGRGQRRIFAERMAGDEPAELRDRAAARGLERAQRRDRGRHQGGLGVLGQAQPLVGPFEDQAAQRLAERRVDLLEHRSGRRHRGEQGLAHADRLRALAREDQCCVHATPLKFRAALLSACAGPVKAQIPRGGPGGAAMEPGPCRAPAFLYSAPRSRIL